MRELPSFDTDGLLPPADYELTFEELRNSILVVGPEREEQHSPWDRAWREELVKNLEVLTRQLWSVGVREIFADGSFVEDKDHPNDIDGYFVCDLHELMTGELARNLNLLDRRRCGHGIRRREGRIVGIRRSNCRCGINTV